MIWSTLGLGSSGNSTRSLSVAMPSSSMADTWSRSDIQYSCSSWKSTGPFDETFKHCIIQHALRKQPQTLYSFFQDSKSSMKELPSSMRPDSKRRALAKDRVALRARSVSLAAHKPRLVMGSLSSTSPSSSSIISSKMAVCPFTLPRMH